MEREEFNPAIMKPLMKLSSEKTINRKIFSSVNKAITPLEKIEFFWSKQLSMNPEDRENYEIYHISRMMRCSLLGFRVRLDKSVGTKDNPTILENSTEFLSEIDSLWKDLSMISNKKMGGEEYSKFLLVRKFDSFSENNEDLIRIGRMEDMKEIPISVVKDVKSTFLKITSEI